MVIVVGGAVNCKAASEIELVVPEVVAEVDTAGIKVNVVFN